MKLSENDKQILLQNGYEPEDLVQIQEAVDKNLYRLYDKKIIETQGHDEGLSASISITAEQAYEILGQETFLSGVGRSAFHYDSSREIEGTASRYGVSFDVGETMFDGKHIEHRENPFVSIENMEEWKEKVSKNMVCEDDKINAIVQYINDITGGEEEYTVEDVEVDEGYSNLYDTYKTPEGEFRVYDEDDRDKYAEEYVENIIDDCGGLEQAYGESAEYIIDNFCEWQDGEDYMHDDYESYYNDIESESASDDIFENRLQEELFEKCCDVSVDMDDYKDYAEKKEAFREPDDMEVLVCDFKEMLLEDSIHIFEDENGVLSTNDEVFEEMVKWVNDENRNIDDFERIENAYFETLYPYDLDDFHSIDEWFFNYEDNKDDLIEQAIEEIIKDYDDPISWYKEQFGDEGLKAMIDNGNISIDYKALAEWVTDNDGYGSMIAYYDGEEHEVCSDGVHIDFYVYKTDNACIPRTSEKAEDMPTIDKNDVKGIENNPKINKGNGKTD